MDISSFDVVCWAVVSLELERRKVPNWSCSSWQQSVASTRGLSSRFLKPTPSWKVLCLCCYWVFVDVRYGSVLLCRTIVSFTRRPVSVCRLLRWLGPFHGAIAVPSVTRCRRLWRRGHQYAGGMRQYSGDTWWIGVRRLIVANGPNIFQMLLVRKKWMYRCGGMVVLVVVVVVVVVDVNIIKVALSHCCFKTTVRGTSTTEWLNWWSHEHNSGLISAEIDCFKEVI